MLILSIFLALLCLIERIIADLQPYNNSNIYELGLHGVYPHQHYITADLEAPHSNIRHWDDRCDDGKLVLLTPRGKFVDTPGPMLLDNMGNLVWLEKKYGMVMDLKVQRYKGEDCLTFWAGRDDGTHGYGMYFMLNSSYDVVRTVKPVGNLLGDLHEFSITKNGTALMTIYSDPEQVDLSAFGRTEPGWIIDAMFQEIDLETGELVFEWKALDHYEVSDTQAPIRNHGFREHDAFDYFHINSIDKDDKGNYYVSSRYMHTITCISPLGKILWKLGGPNSSFTDLSDGAASNFTWQHHMRWYPGNRISIFDNGAFNWLPTADYSRGLHIQLDLDNMTASLIQSYESSDILAHSQGSMQILDNGDVFVGWGHTAAYTQFAKNGSILCDVHYGASAFFDFGWAESYRAFKADWVGRPRTLPAIGMGGQQDAVYVSWNGATEVASWRLEAAVDKDFGFEEVVTVLKHGFETRMPLHVGIDDQLSRGLLTLTGTPDIYTVLLRVAAVDAKGNVLAISKTLDASTGRYVGEPARVLGDDGVSPVAWLALLCILACFLVIMREFALEKEGGAVRLGDVESAYVKECSVNELGQRMGRGGDWR